MPLKLRCGYQFITMAAIGYFMARKRKLESNLLFYRKISRTATLDTLQSRSFWMFASSSILVMQCIRNPKGMDEEKKHLWWERGYHNWTDDQFKKRERVTCETFQYILGVISDQIRKETTKFKVPTSPECQLGLTLYRRAHGSSYSTVGDLFGVAPSTACTIFNSVINVIVQSMYDDLVKLPQSDEEWKKEITSFIEDWKFPCVGAWDGFHVYINCHLKNCFSFKKRYSATNMGLIASNKRFLWAGVGAPGSMHDTTLLHSADIFSAIETSHCIPHQVLE